MPHTLTSLVARFGGQECMNRLMALRSEMNRRGLDGFVVPRADEYQGERVPGRAERLAWLTAFTGTAGTAVVLAERAAIFVDGRYTIQVRRQTDTALFEPLGSADNAWISWIAANVKKGAQIGYDPWLHTYNSVVLLEQAITDAGAGLVPCFSNPIDVVWLEQPAAPLARAWPHDLQFAGETSESKRAKISALLNERGADSLVLTMSDSICWLLNIRGGDIERTPFVLAFSILKADGSLDLFLDSRKSSPELVRHLGLKVRLRDPADFVSELEAQNGKAVMADPASGASAVFALLAAAGARVIRCTDPCQLPKACKNAVELEGMRQAHIRDGAALTCFLAWFAREAPNGHLTEMDAARKLEAFRRRSPSLLDLSFDSISAAGPNAAIPHYRPTTKIHRAIGLGDIYLIDSGGHYPDGTTDVTRTVIVGTPTAEMRDRFTRVLLGHIALATARFPEGTTGGAVDGFARRWLWDAGLDFDHGAGHGVGACLGVHEGPQNISKRNNSHPLLPGMVCSNEPGYYKEGDYGIRIENLMIVSEAAAVPGGERKMMGFETITFCPIDVSLIDVALLGKSGADWLNSYHRRVREILSPLVDVETRIWLEKATQPI